MFALAALSGGRPLSTLTRHLFEASGLADAFQMDAVKLKRFLLTIEAG